MANLSLISASVAVSGIWPNAWAAICFSVRGGASVAIDTSEVSRVIV
jgi:hypothetical protein